jgi:toxin ParE1/3/4
VKPDIIFSARFASDIVAQAEWYKFEADQPTADRFVDAVQATLNTLMYAPEMGRKRFTRHPELSAIRSFRIHPPFHRFLMFYRTEPGVLILERLIHGARDLPRRLRAI